MDAAAANLESLPLHDDGGDGLAVIEATQASRRKTKYHGAWSAFVRFGPLGRAPTSPRLLEAGAQRFAAER